MKNVDTASGWSRPGAGGYIIQITRALNNPKSQRLEIEYDIVDGEFKGYYQDLYNRRGFWGGNFIKSYKPNALPFLKQFIEVILESNQDCTGLVIGDFDDIDETRLPGKYLGIVYGMEEYRGNDGKIKQRPDHYNAIFMTPAQIQQGTFEVPELKLLENKPAPAAVVDTTQQMPEGFIASANENPF